MKAQRKKPTVAIKTELDETVARLLQTDPKELEDAIERVRRKRGEIEKHAEDIERDIKEGFDRPRKRFRP